MPDARMHEDDDAKEEGWGWGNRSAAGLCRSGGSAGCFLKKLGGNVMNETKMRYIYEMHE